MRETDIIKIIDEMLKISSLLFDVMVFNLYICYNIQIKK